MLYELPDPYYEKAELLRRVRRPAQWDIVPISPEDFSEVIDDWISSKDYQDGNPDKRAWSNYERLAISRSLDMALLRRLHRDHPSTTPLKLLDVTAALSRANLG